MIGVIAPIVGAVGSITEGIKRRKLERNIIEQFENIERVQCTIKRQTKEEA